MYMIEALFVLIFLSVPIFCLIGFVTFVNFLAKSLKKPTSNSTPAEFHVQLKVIDPPTPSRHKEKEEQAKELPTFAGNVTRWVSVIISFIYVVFVGAGAVPVGAQITILTTSFLVFFLYLCRQRKWKITYRSILFLIIMGIIGIYSMITTNYFLTLLNYFSLVGLAGMFLLFLAQGSFPTTMVGLGTDTGRYLTFSYLHFFSFTSWKRFFSLPSISLKKRTLNSEIVFGFFISLPLLLLFHFLFSRVNLEYATFVQHIFTQIWRFLVYIWELDIVEIILKTFLVSSLVFPFLSVKVPAEKYQLSERQKAYLSVFHILLGSSVLIFGLFSFFQARLLFMNFAAVPFKELSTYVIQGFWELVAVSIVGYVLSLLVLREVEHSHLKQIPTRTKTLLTIFTSELIAVVVFTLHKLYTHQFFFGFKDQRILATGGVVIILVTFIALLLRIWRDWKSSLVFTIQLFSVLLMVVGFNLLNIDLFVSRVNPLSYYVNQAKYKDYSYLLGNSYDNSSEWAQLTDEALRLHPPQPESDAYYYGWYPSLCQPFVLQGPYADYRTARSGDNSSYLQDKYRYLEKKYGQAEKKDLKQITQFNWNEYQAYQVLQVNHDKLEQVVSQLCPPKYPPGYQYLPPQNTLVQ
jgi:hypothetical protein